MFKILLICVVTIPLLYNGLIFTAVNKSGYIYNPNIPFSFKILKDVVVLTAIFIPLLSHHVRKRLKMPGFFLLYIFFSTSVALTMCAIAIIKYDIDLRLLGILKNYLVYYPASGVLALLVNHYKKEKYFFNIFRLSMFLVLLLGLLFYFIAKTDFTFTFSGRMISLLGNPNYLSYLSMLYIFVLFGFIYFQSRISFLITFELIIAHLGLFLSFSYTSIPCYSVALIIMFIIWYLELMPKNKLLIKIIIMAIFNSAIGSLAVFLTKYFRGGIFSVAFEQKVEPLSKVNITELPFVQSRISTFHMSIAEIFSSLESFLFGTFHAKEYIENPSAFLNLAFNFGMPVLTAWLVYFIVPIFFVAASFKKIRTSEDFNAGMTFMLSILITCSLLIYFWVQYLPEKFPTCFFIGFVLSYILINALQLKCTNETVK